MKQLICAKSLLYFALIFLFYSTAQSKEIGVNYTVGYNRIFDIGNKKEFNYQITGLSVSCDSKYKNKIIFGCSFKIDWNNRKEVDESVKGFYMVHFLIGYSLEYKNSLAIIPYTGCSILNYSYLNKNQDPIGIPLGVNVVYTFRLQENSKYFLCLYINNSCNYSNINNYNIGFGNYYYIFEAGFGYKLFFGNQKFK